MPSTSTNGGIGVGAFGTYSTKGRGTMNPAQSTMAALAA
jgi:hypothetical protein